MIVNFSRRFAASSTRATHLALGAGGGGGAARPVVICGAAAGGRVRRAAVHRAVARRAVVVAAVQIARALSVIVAVTLAWKYYWGIIISFVQVSQGHENSRKSNFCLKKCINPLHVMSLVWNEPWLI